MDRKESGTPTCALNSTLIGMYKGNVLEFMRTHSFIHLDIFMRRRAFGFERFSVGNPRKSLYTRPQIFHQLKLFGASQNTKRSKKTQVS